MEKKMTRRNFLKLAGSQWQPGIESGNEDLLRAPDYRYDVSRGDRVLSGELR